MAFEKDMGDIFLMMATSGARRINVLPKAMKHVVGFDYLMEKQPKEVFDLVRYMGSPN